MRGRLVFLIGGLVAAGWWIGLGIIVSYIV